MKTRTKGWLVIGLALAVVAGSAVVAVQSQAQKRQAEAAAKQRPPLEFAPADLVQVALHPVASELVLPGTVQAVSRATVRAKLSAEVRRVLVREGDRVTAGQVVAQFDTAQLKVKMLVRSRPAARRRRACRATGGPATLTGRAKQRRHAVARILGANPWR